MEPNSYFRELVTHSRELGVSEKFAMFSMEGHGFEKMFYVHDPWRPRCTLGVTTELNFLF
jgi:hypothetical protein